RARGRCRRASRPTGSACCPGRRRGRAAAPSPAPATAHPDEHPDERAGGVDRDVERRAVATTDKGLMHLVRGGVAGREDNGEPGPANGTGEQEPKDRVL